ncbi:hypothetical protein SLA2020_278400 [Shorea laevis]
MSQIVVLYLVSFGDHRTYAEVNEDDEDDEYDYDNEGEDDGGHSRIDRDDPYWDEIYEPNLFNEENDAARSSMNGPRVEEGENEKGHGDGHNKGEKDGGPSGSGRAGANGFDDDIRIKEIQTWLPVTSLSLPPIVMRRMILYRNLACMCSQL